MNEELDRRIVHYKKALGEQKLRMLDVLFDAISHLPEGVSAMRFRADHPDWIAGLDELQSKHNLIERSNDRLDLYRVKPYILPLVGSPRAKAILEAMERLLPHLKEIYIDRLDEKVTVKEFEDLKVAELDVLHDALYMMVESYGFFGGRTNDFPESADSSTIIREAVLEVDSCLNELTRYYDTKPYGLSAMLAISSLADFDNRERIELPSIIGACGARSGAAESLHLLDEQEKRMLVEVDEALNAGLCALSVMGIRALFDMFVHKHVRDMGSFSRSLSVLQESGHLSGRQADLISPVFDLGSATMHRGYYPSAEDVRVCVEIYGHIIRQERSLISDAEGMKGRVPQRENKKPKG